MRCSSARIDGEDETYAHDPLASALDPGLNFDLISRTGLSVSRLFGSAEWEIYQVSCHGLTSLVVESQPIRVAR